MKLLTKSVIVTALAMVFFISNSLAQDAPFKPTVKINGRIQADLEFIDAGGDTDAVSGFEFRRVYLSAKGSVGKKLKYKAEFEFAGGDIRYRDMHIQYAGGNTGNFAFGSKAEPTGLDMATSSKYSPFFERAAITNIQNFRWANGFHYDNFNILDKKIGLQVAYTFNDNHKGAFKAPNLKNESNLIARVSSAVINNKENHTLVHVGINYANRSGDENKGYRFKFRPNNHMGNKVSVSYTGEVVSRTEVGFETAVNFGSISIQGEYKTATVATDDKDYKIGGFYAMATYFLTGEFRPYKKGAFGRVKPNSSIGNGGFGAFELLAKYSTLDTADGATTFMDNITDGKTSSITIGFNWYLNANTKIMYNYVNTNFAYTNLADNPTQSAHLIRVATDF